MPGCRMTWRALTRHGVGGNGASSLSKASPQRAFPSPPRGRGRVRGRKTLQRLTPGTRRRMDSPAASARWAWVMTINDCDWGSVSTSRTRRRSALHLPACRSRRESSARPTLRTPSSDRAEWHGSSSSSELPSWHMRPAGTSPTSSALPCTTPQGLDPVVRKPDGTYALLG